MRTFKSLPDETRALLRILWTTEKYTPHAFAMHPRVEPALAKRITQAFEAVDGHPQREAMLSPLKFKGMMGASDSDWNDVRALGLNELVHLEAPLAP